MNWTTNNIGTVIFYQVKSLVSNRVYPIVAPQDVTQPYIVYNIISTVPDHTKSTTSVADKVRVQLDIIGKDIDALNIIASNVRDSLDLLSGTIGGVTVNTSRFDGENTFFLDDVRLYNITQDYIIRIATDGISSGVVLPGAPQVFVAQTADFTASLVIPAGFDISQIVLENTSIHAGQISCGTTAGGYDIFFSVPILANSIQTVTVNQTISMSADTNLYFNHSQSGDTWNNMTLNIYIVLIKIK